MNAGDPIRQYYDSIVKTVTEANKGIANESLGLVEELKQGFKKIDYERNKDRNEDYDELIKKRKKLLEGPKEFDWAKGKFLEPVNSGSGGRSRGGGRSATDKALLDAQRGFEQLQRQLEQTRQTGLSAYQKEQYAQNIAKLQEALALKAISQEQYYQNVEALEQEHQNKMAEIQRQADLFIADLLGDPVLKLQDEYSRKLELLEQYHADQLVCEQVYLQAMKALYDKYYEEMGKKKDKEKDDKGGFLGISTKGWQATNKLVSNTANLFDSLTQSMNESSGAYKALFAVQKSFAVASAIVNCMAAISDAMSKSKLGWYENRISKDDVQQSDINGFLYCKEVCPMKSERQLQIEVWNREIFELKEELNATDYKAIKYAEGVMTDEEYQPVGIQRKAWRHRINELEEMIKG